MPLRVDPQLAWQVVDGEAVIVDVEAGRMLGLSPVGSCLWPLLESHDESQLVDEVVQRFQVDDETARRDIRTFLAELRERGLVLSA